LIPTCLCTKLGETWARLGLMTAAKRRAIDSFRRGRMLVQKHQDIARELEWQQQQLGDAMEHSRDQVIDDDILRLILTACHPVLTVEARIAFTLRLIFAEELFDMVWRYISAIFTLGGFILRFLTFANGACRRLAPS
jgi:RNA polymerase sigma-70 factor (ECF subfamily)